MGVFERRSLNSRIDLAEEREFEVGGMCIKPAEAAVVMDGQRRDVQPRVLKVLIALARARPQVVSRSRIGELCWDGRIVGDDALNRCILTLRHLAQEFSPSPFSIETVPRVGHRLLENGQASERSRSRTNRLHLAVTIASLAIALIVALIFWQQRSISNGPASIAVMPFRNLDNGDSYFAEGISEEILGELAREPQFRVAGSNSSVQALRYGDIQQVGERLGVDYVVEGAVRRQGGRIRVSAHLLRSRDGVRLWSDSYDGDLDDIFAIQRNIGIAISGALKRKLVRTQRLSDAQVTNGHTYNLYLTARGLLRTRNRRTGPIAADLLRDAIQADPRYAPAWARLGEATLLAGALNDGETLIASAMRAQAYARHALRLAPEMPEAHRTLGALFGFGTPEAVIHLRRAAELEPNNAENMIGLGATYGATGEFEKEIAAYRRASELDPLWFRAISAHALATAEMGDRGKAEAIARRGLGRDDIQTHVLLAKIASASGDHSEALRLWTLAAGSNSRRWSQTATRIRDDVAFALRLKPHLAVAVPRPLDQRHLWRVLMVNPPTPSVWRLRNRDAMAAAVYRDDNHVAAKLMLNAGRSAELAAAYDAAGGLIGIREGARLRIDQLHEVAVVALALRSAEREQEANRILNEAQTLVRKVYKRGRVPMSFEVEAAAISAAQGREGEAVSRLARAVGRGWRHGGYTDLIDFADEPAFRALDANPRFQRLSRQLAAHYSKERMEAVRWTDDKEKGPLRRSDPFVAAQMQG